MVSTTTFSCALSTGFLLPPAVPLPAASAHHHHHRRCVSFGAISSRRCSGTGEDGSGSTSDAGIRLNKVFKATHSRRQSDVLVQEGRVSINGVPVDPGGVGGKVVPFVDVISLDGHTVKGWEEMNGFVRQRSHSSVPKDSRARTKSKAEPKDSRSRNGPGEFDPNAGALTYEYIKYWKPRGVICTTDRTIRNNLLDELGRDGYVPPHRVFPVGRLDKDTSGLILITSDGRLPNSALRSKANQPKTYKVSVDYELRPEDLDKLRDGIVITTIAQRDRGVAKPLTAPTLPSIVEQTGECSLQITIFEGRNRQIRKMMAALDYNVLKLQRIKFMDIGLHPLKRAGDWSKLDVDEMSHIYSLLGIEN